MARSRRRKPVPAVFKRPSLDFSFTGFVYSTMMMFMGLAAVNTQANLLFGVFGLMMGVLIVAWSISRLVLRRIHIERVLPEHTVVGKPATFQYRFTNTKRFWPSFSICLSELDGVEAFVKQPVAYMLHAAPRMAATVPIEIVPRKRGLHTLCRFQLSTSFPFGFIKRATDHREEQTVLVFPAIATVAPELLSLCRSADQSGTTMRPRRGGDDEFYGIREYRPGENPRHIYWRRSARTGTLVTKEMTRVSPPRLILLVDTFVSDPASAAEQAEIERAIAMAASLAWHALEAGLVVGIFAWSDDWLAVTPNRGKRYRRDILAHLAQLRQNSVKDTQALLDAGRHLMRSGATTVLFTPRDLQAGIADHGRSNLMVISTTSPQAQKWFTFDDGVDFSATTPWEIEPRAAADLQVQDRDAQRPPEVPASSPGEHAAMR